MIAGMRLVPPRITRCPGLDDDTASAAHAVDAVLHAGGDHADQRAGDQHTEEGDDQREDTSAPPDVAGHRAGVEDPEQALPGVLAHELLLLPPNVTPKIVSSIELTSTVASVTAPSQTSAAPVPRASTLSNR